MIGAVELRKLVDESDFTLTYWCKFIEDGLIAQAKLGKRFLNLDEMNGFRDPKFKVAKPSLYPVSLTAWQKCLESKLGVGLQLKIATHEYTERHDDDPVENDKIRIGYHLQICW